MTNLAHKLPEPEYTYAFKTKPYPYQFKCWNAAKDKPSYAFFLEQGLGKTLVTIYNASYLYDTKKIDGLLVIAPAGVYGNWFRKEIPEHMPDHVQYSMAMYYASPKATDRAAVEKLFVKDGKLHILLMNVESFSGPKGIVCAERFLMAHKSLAVCDESTSLKNPTAKRTKALIKLGELAEYKRILSGEPAANSPLNLYAQFDFLGKRLLGFGSYFAFRNRFAILEQMKMRYQNEKGEDKVRLFDQVVGYRNLEELQDIIKPYAFTAKKAECLPFLPPKIYQTIDVFMSGKQADAYKTMKNECMLVVEEIMSGVRAPRKVANIDLAEEEAQFNLSFEDWLGSEVGETVQTPGQRISSAEAVITQLLRLHQIACGFMTVDQTKEIIPFYDNPRMDQLIEDLEIIPGKVIIWATYKHNIRQIAEKLVEKFGPDSFVTFYGDTDRGAREMAVSVFQDFASPVRFFLANETAAFGLTLTAAETVIYYSNNYDGEKRNQSEDRAHRIGQTKSVVYRDYVCPGTVDVKILAALKEKKDLSNLVTPSNWREFFE